ncbi:MAG: hypothetical protein J7M03_02540, partial [Candidatus Desulfofervidaceae bacterium]|nr:hypothetical protein [Candidatus Desulfofervidaceae bacterium]
MKKWIVLCWLLLCVTNAFGQEVLKISIPPFTVYASQSLLHLGKEIPQKLSQKMPSDKVIIVPWKLEQPPQSIEDARHNGEKIGADYVVMGSLTQVGERLSLDAVLIETGGIRPPLPIYKEVYSMEALEEGLGQFAKEIVYRLFKKEKIAR